MGTSVVTVKPKTKTTQTKMSTQQMPIQPDFYLPDGKGSRLSEVHQIKTTEKSPEGHPAVLLVLENLRAKYKTKYFLLDRYSGYLYAAGGETISLDPIDEKEWIYPTESTRPIASAPDEFRLMFGTMYLNYSSFSDNYLLSRVIPKVPTGARTGWHICDMCPPLPTHLCLLVANRHPQD